MTIWPLLLTESRHGLSLQPSMQRTFTLYASCSKAQQFPAFADQIPLNWSATPHWVTHISLLTTDHMAQDPQQNRIRLTYNVLPSALMFPTTVLPLDKSLLFFKIKSFYCCNASNSLLWKCTVWSDMSPMRLPPVLSTFGKDW